MERAYLDKKREIAPDRLKELDIAYNYAIMATFAPVKAFAASAPAIVPQPQPTALPDPGKRPGTAHDESAENLSSLVEETPVSLSDERVLLMDAGQLRRSYEPFQEQPVIYTWGIKNALLRRYVMIYAAFVVLGLIVAALGGRPTHSIMSSMAAQQADISAQQAEHGAELLYSIATAQSHLHTGPETAQLMRDTARQVRETAEQARETAQQMRAEAVPPTMLVAILIVFVSTVYYFLCALPVPFILRFLIMGERAEGGGVYIMSMISMSTASVLRFLTSGWLGNWAGDMIVMAFAALLLGLITVSYEGS